MSKTNAYGINLWALLLESLQKLQVFPGICCVQVDSLRMTKVNYAVSSPDENNKCLLEGVGGLIHYIM